MKKRTRASCLLLFFFFFKAYPATSCPGDTSRNGRFSLVDSLVFDSQIAFMSHDSVLFFFTGDGSRLSQKACAVFYRPARMNKYFQFDGQVTDYYVENDSIAARLSYQEGYLNGPCTFYYKNGTVREKGEYVKNARNGIWEYYYENGEKAKSIRFTDSSVSLIDCFAEDGTVLARNGNGRFDGRVITNSFENPFECRVTGDVKNGSPDGKWSVYLNSSSTPTYKEFFEDGAFIRGSSYSLAGQDSYYDRHLSRFESIHHYERLDYYGQNDFCWIAGKRISGSAGWKDRFPELDEGFRTILKTNLYKDFSGWVFLDIKYNKKGRITGKFVRMSQRDPALEKDILNMLDGLNNQGSMTINDKNVEYEKFYIVLLDSNEAVIPEEILKKQWRIRLQ